MTKVKILDTSLVLTTGFLVVYLVTKVDAFLYVALTFGIIGILFPGVAKWVAIAWFKLADVLSFIMSKLVLGAVFYIFLVPIAMLYQIFKSDKLMLRKPAKTLWIDRNCTYQANDLENIW